MHLLRWSAQKLAMRNRAQKLCSWRHAYSRADSWATKQTLAKLKSTVYTERADSDHNKINKCHQK